MYGITGISLFMGFLPETDQVQTAVGPANPGGSALGFFFRRFAKQERRVGFLVLIAVFLIGFILLQRMRAPKAAASQGDTA
jgi:MFS-type transporter involved in bile tolerance (Atg22 family)